ncbi:MAG TPA: pilus assembly protein [Blastocatellia bacterium]|nr:pilus assembly protein [Blastocatellia bacterium]HMX24543.1 pilus assembly protein [Blastocatellia bacterium]HMZ17189.1 pilus assembly protein [Blastocatellia bacterium]HNG31882.1 pilus assembly protein [Blastocatellia bacterium]
MRSLQKFPFQVINPRKKQEQGQALLEFALILPILFIMLLGVVVIAQGFNLQMVLYGAAYEGARIWAKNPAGGDNSHCTPPACKGNGNNFEAYVIPAVRQYLTNNGFDGSEKSGQLFFYAKDDRTYRNSLNIVSNNPQLVNITLLYSYKLPLGNFAASFEEVVISASCTLKRGG